MLDDPLSHRLDCLDGGNHSRGEDRVGVGGIAAFSLALAALEVSLTIAMIMSTSGLGGLADCSFT